MKDVVSIFIDLSIMNKGVQPHFVFLLSCQNEENASIDATATLDAVFRPKTHFSKMEDF